MSKLELIKNELSKYDLFYGNLIHFQQLDYHRDFEVLLLTNFGITKLRILLKGVISINYISKIKRDDFSLDDKFLISNLPPPYEAYHWGIKNFEISNWLLKDSSPLILELQKDYNFKLYKLTFETNSSDISFIFGNLEVDELKN